MRRASEAFIRKVHPDSNNFKANLENKRLQTI